MEDKPRSRRWREDGTYDKSPNDPEYFKKYYHAKMACKVKCNHCDKEVTRSNMLRHCKMKHFKTTPST